MGEAVSYVDSLDKKIELNDLMWYVICTRENK